MRQDGRLIGDRGQGRRCRLGRAVAGRVRSVPGDNADGSYTPDGIALQALGTRANGEVIQGLDY